MYSIFPIYTARHSGVLRRIRTRASEILCILLALNPRSFGAYHFYLRRDSLGASIFFYRHAIGFLDFPAAPPVQRRQAYYISTRSSRQTTRRPSRHLLQPLPEPQSTNSLLHATPNPSIDAVSALRKSNRKGPLICLCCPCIYSILHTHSTEAT